MNIHACIPHILWFDCFKMTYTVTTYMYTLTHIIPVRYPIICLSKLLNCCLYLSLEACGTAQSLGPETRGDITEGDEEAELKDKQQRQKHVR